MAPRTQLADCKAEFQALIGFFGENPAAAPQDTEFWEVCGSRTPFCSGLCFLVFLSAPPLVLGVARATSRPNAGC